MAKLSKSTTFKNATIDLNDMRLQNTIRMIVRLTV